MAIIDLEKLFAQEAYSDVTIKFGPADAPRSIPCHRMILCEASGYFKKLCGPGSKFKESNQRKITLHDDDPVALEAALRSIYQFTYEVLECLETDGDTQGQAAFHLNVYTVADKYDLPRLTDKAQEQLSTWAHAVTDAQTAMDIIEAISVSDVANEKFAALPLRLVKTHLVQLSELPRFSEWLGAQSGLLALLVKDLAIYYSIEGLRVYTCPGCRKDVGIFDRRYKRTCPECQTSLAQCPERTKWYPTS